MPVNRRPAEQFAQLVEQNGAEFGVTVIVHGLVIEGVLTPAQRWSEWTLGALHDMHQANVRPARAPALTRQESEDIRKAWHQRYGDSDSIVLAYDRICLRNASLATVPNPEFWPVYPYLLIETDSIDAITLGTRKKLF